jgi:hypothetical protein
MHGYGLASLSLSFFFLSNRSESLDSGLEHGPWHGATKKNHAEALRKVPGHVACRFGRTRVTGCTAFPAILALLTLHFSFCYSIYNPLSFVERLIAVDYIGLARLVSCGDQDSCVEQTQRSCGKGLV